MRLLAAELDLLSRFGISLTPKQWTMATIVVAVFAVCIGLWSIFQLRAWFREDAGHADDNLKLLTQFRDLHREGGLSEDEYRLIKGRLVGGYGPQSAAGQRPPTSAETAGWPWPTNGMDGPRDDSNGESRSGDKPPTMEADTRETTDGDTTDRENSTRDGSGKNPDEAH